MFNKYIIFQEDKETIKFKNEYQRNNNKIAQMNTNLRMQANVDTWKEFWTCANEDTIFGVDGACRKCLKNETKEEN